MRRVWRPASGRDSTSCAQTGGGIGRGSRRGAMTAGKPATRRGREPWTGRGAGSPDRGAGARAGSGDRALARRLLVDDDRRCHVLAGVDHFGGTLRALVPVLAQLGSPLLATHRVEEVGEGGSGSRHQQRSGQAHLITLATVIHVRQRSIQPFSPTRGNLDVTTN